MSEQEPPRRVKARKTAEGWSLALDNAAWAELMTALSIAIEATRTSDQDRAARLRTLRSALSTADLEPESEASSHE